MTANKLIIRGIRNEKDIAQNGLDAIRANKVKAALRRDDLQAQLDSVKTEIQKMNTDIDDSLTLIESLQAEIDAVQARP